MTKGLNSEEKPLTQKERKKGFSEDYTHFKVVSGLLYSVAQAGY